MGAFQQRGAGRQSGEIPVCIGGRILASEFDRNTLAQPQQDVLTKVKVECNKIHAAVCRGCWLLVSTMSPSHYANIMLLPASLYTSEGTHNA